MGRAVRLPRLRIIPACAGSTWSLWRFRRSRGDHPRLRGEHITPVGARSRARGSSPLARGALAVVASRGLRGGIIPACAGSTSSASRERARARDHPRLRGEHPYATRLTKNAGGSSPLARGALLPPTFFCLLPRIIPACAGSTISRSPPSLSGGDHPRLRGEHASEEHAHPLLRGSSPLARGALLPVDFGYVT